MPVNFLQKLSQNIHTHFQKTFADKHFPQRLSDAITLNYMLYSGQLPDYEACKCPYHDYEHITDVTECLLLLISQYVHYKPSNAVDINSSDFTCAIVAALFHDMGLIHRKNESLRGFHSDHEARGAELAGNLLSKDQWSQEEVSLIQNMIRGTHPTSFKDIIAQAKKQNDPLREFLVKALRTADYLGQMGQADYIERLPLLYKEIKEACFAEEKDHNDFPYHSIEALLNDTSRFWENVFQKILQKECSSLYQYLADPFPDGPNIYINTIQQHMEYLQKRAARHG